MLTDKQEKYIQGLLSGLSQRKAYREAYPRSRNWKDATVDKRASELFKNREVLGRYTSLKKKQEKEHMAKNLWTREESVNKLKWLIEKTQLDMDDKGIRQANSTAFINAIKELNALEGIGKERESKINLDDARIEKLKAEINIDKVDTQEDKVAELLEGVLNVHEETD